MSFLSGPTPGEGQNHDADIQHQHLDFISEQPTEPTLVQTQPELATMQQEAAAGYQMSPILEHAVKIARERDFVIPLCPLCLMAYEEEAGEFISLDNTIPQFCYAHQKWLKQGSAHDRYLKMHVMHTALSWYLWPPGAHWPDLGNTPA